MLRYYLLILKNIVSSSTLQGVSCSSPTGLSAKQALEICRLAGKDKRVALFDLSEYNPVIEEYRTGRLVAMMFHTFCTSLALNRKG